VALRASGGWNRAASLGTRSTFSRRAVTMRTLAVIPGISIWRGLLAWIITE
jgi:hypothetical protein